MQQNLLNGPLATAPATDPGRPKIRQLFHEILLFFAHTYSEVFGLTTGPPLHDPIAIAVLLDQLGGYQLFDDTKKERWHVTVVTVGSHSPVEEEQGKVGMTMVIPAEADLDDGGVRIPRKIEVDRFWEIVELCMQRAEEAISLPKDSPENSSP